MNTEIEHQTYLNAAIEFAKMSESTRSSVYGSILTINSVLIGACGIMQAINSSLPKNIILTYLVFSLIPMIIIFSLYSRIRTNQISMALQNIVSAIESNSSLMDKYKTAYEKFKDEKGIPHGPKVMFTLERMATFFTVINVLFFVFIVYLS